MGRITRRLLCGAAITLTVATAGAALAAAGDPLGPAVKVYVESPSHQSKPAVARNGSGASIVAWTSEPSFGPTLIYARRYDAAGAPLDDGFQVSSGIQYDSYAAVALDDQGGSLVTWLRYPYSIWARSYDANGVPRGPEFRIDDASSSSVSSEPAVATTPDGEAAIVWAGFIPRFVQSDQILLQRLTTSGQRRGNPKLVSEVRVPAAATDVLFLAGAYANALRKPDVGIGGGQIVVAWRGMGSTEAQDETLGLFSLLIENRSIYTQRFGLDATPSGSPRLVQFGLNTDAWATIDHDRVRIAVDRFGDYSLAWGEPTLVKSRHSILYAKRVVGGRLGERITVANPAFEYDSFAIAGEPSGAFTVAFYSTDAQSFLFRRFGPDSRDLGRLTDSGITGIGPALAASPNGDLSLVAADYIPSPSSSFIVMRRYEGP